MNTMNDRQTLASRLNEGRIPVSEALHYAMSLADALRKLHDAGKAHGAVTPASIELTSTGLELIPSLGPLATITPYTAPELLQGQPADARSDIFSFGALVFEMLTGRQAFEGESQTELKLALCNATPPPSGSPAVDRLVSSCVAKSSAARWQRMQKIIMELKLLSVAARKAEKPAVSRVAADAAMRAEMAQIEARLSERLSAHEKNLAESQKTVADAVQALREQVTVLQERPVQAPIDMDAFRQQIEARIADTIAAVSQQLRAHAIEAVTSSVEQQAAHTRELVDGIAKQAEAKANETLASANEAATASNVRAAAVERNLEEIREHFATLQARVAGDLHEFEKTLRVQGVAIDSARTAMAQTDDLVERVVEALELLQSSIIDQNETAVVN